MFFSDSTPLGIDATGWTALATIIALSLGLIGFLINPISAWFRRPKLELQFSKIADHSERIGDRYQLRLPIANASGKSAAENVEVFLEMIDIKHVGIGLKLPKYLPIRHIWTHAGGAVCDHIAGGAYRLLDLGVLIFTINSSSTFVESVMAGIQQTNPIELKFNFEIQPTTEDISLPVGTYTFHFLITSALSLNRQTVTFTILNCPLQDGVLLEDFIRIN